MDYSQLICYNPTKLHQSIKIMSRHTHQNLNTKGTQFFVRVWKGKDVTDCKEGDHHTMPGSKSTGSLVTNKAI